MGARGLMGVLGLTLVVLVLATSSLSTPAEATGALMFKKSTKKKASKKASTSTKMKVGFYTGSCATVETQIRNAVVAKAKQDPTIIPALIRLFFHDCFANGKCDASVLLKGTSTTKTELDSTTNLTLRGLDFIDFLKSMLTKANCTQVSCADIIALSARDAVVAGGGTSYSIPTGRKDGKTSLKADADNMPTSRTVISGILAQFSNKGFSAQEMVVLTGGGHTVGKTHCGFFFERLWNFFNTGKPDPQMNSTLVTELQKVCPNQSGLGNSTFLDRGTPSVMDNVYFKQLLIKKGVMQSDQGLLQNTETKPLVTALAQGQNSAFLQQFATAMVKLGNLGPITSTKLGEIRKVCSKIN